MGMVFTTGLMEVNSKEIGRKTKSLEWVFISGKMEEFMKATGSKIICMDKVYTSGQMEENTKVAISTTKKKALVFTPIQTVDATEAIGKMVSNTAKEYS